MRLLLLCMMVFSMAAFAQTRVKENIKQQSVAVDENGSSRPVAKPQKKKNQ